MEDHHLLTDKLNLIPHPEGGFYRRNWLSLLSGDLKDSTGKVIFPSRSIGSSILYLLPAEMVCKWHRVKCDEMWHHYRGFPLRMYLLPPRKTLETVVLGSDIAQGQIPQFIVHRDTWFAAEPLEKEGFALCGCTLWPSFTYSDFELAEPGKLADEYPAYRDLIYRIQEHKQ